MNKTIKQKSIISIMVVSIMLILAACGDAVTETTTVATTVATNVTTSSETKASESSDQVFNKEELAKYTGVDGQEAYVAVDGIVYDVTSLGKWKDGKHNGMTAGMDLSSQISKSPHGKAIFTKKNVPVVGKYQE